MEQADAEIYDLSWGADLIVIYRQYWSAASRRKSKVSVEDFIALLGRLWDGGLIRLEMDFPYSSVEKHVVLAYILAHWPYKHGWESEADSVEQLIFLETLGCLHWLDNNPPSSSEVTRKAIYGKTQS